MTTADPPTAPPSVAAIYRYPVKGLSAEALGKVDVRPGETLPFDRMWAIENGPGRFDPAAPRHLPKVNFLMLMRDERLAGFESHFDSETQVLTVLRAGRPVCRGALNDKSGRAVIEQFLAAYMEKSLRGPPHIVSANGHSFSDVSAKCLHIINMASVRELERDIGRPIDPLRFRPNLILQGAAPWNEETWIGREAVVGSARVAVFKSTTRCAATNVEPGTGRRDMDIPAVLARRWGHINFGIYATVVSPGTIAAGDTFQLVD